MEGSKRGILKVLKIEATMEGNEVMAEEDEGV